MKIWLAGVPGGGMMGDCKRERELNTFWIRRLWTFYYLTEKSKDMNKENKVDLFLDSGAFSAWSQKKEINIQEYIQFIKENIDVINIYANLDVIGSAEKTWENQKIMEEAGLHPLPTFHFGEDKKWLSKYLGKYDYICLGGMVGGSNSALMQWLDDLFINFLADDKGYPFVKLHGFGLTSLPLMLRYPWYSVDSTSWVVTGRMGGIFMPYKKDGKWTYDENSWKVNVSNKSSSLKEEGRHLSNFSPLKKQIVMDYLAEKGYKMGKSEIHQEKQGYKLQENEKWFEKKPGNKNELRAVETIIEAGVSNKYQLRDELNIIYFLDLEKSMPEWPWPFKRKTIKSFQL
jgi:hypothetical protein